MCPFWFCLGMRIRSNSVAPILLRQCRHETGNLLGVLGVIWIPSDNIPSLKACVCCVIQTLIFQSILLLHIVCETQDYLDRG